MQYVVKREHFGDRQYLPGDTREATPSDVAHLVRNGVLIEVKVEPPFEAKARAKK